MRPLKIASRPEKTFVLETALPEFFRFVARIAEQWTETQESFHEMCLTGLKAAQDFKATADSRHYHSFVARVLQNRILEWKRDK